MSKRVQERESRHFQRGFQSILSTKIPNVEAIQSPKVSGVCWIQLSDLTSTKIKIYETGLKILDINLQFSTNKINSGTNVIVISQTVVKNKPNTVVNLLNKYFKPEEYKDKFVVSDEWIQECIMIAKIIDFSPYIVPVIPADSLPNTIASVVSVATAQPLDKIDTSSGSKRKQVEPLFEPLDSTNPNGKTKFFCVQSGTAVEKPPIYNEPLIGQLELCKNASTNNAFQRRNYDKVINIVKAEPIKSYSEFEALYPKSKTSTISKKVREFFESGIIPKAELVRTNPQDVAVTELKSVWGIGEKTAKDLVRAKKVMSIEELRRRVEEEPDFLTHSQLIGLKRHEDIIQKIPRNEVEQILEVVRIAAQNIEPNCEVVAGGSYRRGEFICGDVDIIIGPAHGKSFIGIGPQLINELTRSKFITDQLTRFGSKNLIHESRKKEDDDENAQGDSADVDDLEGEYERDTQSSTYSFMGICKLPHGIHRRIDIKTYPRKMFAYAMLAFTGSAHFNRSMRFYARKEKDMQLSDQGLWNLKKDDSGHNKVTVSAYHPNDRRVKGSPIVCHTEEDIFKALGLPYKAPNERSGFAVAADGFYLAVDHDPNELGDDSNDEGENIHI